MLFIEIKINKLTKRMQKEIELAIETPVMPKPNLISNMLKKILTNKEKDITNEAVNCQLLATTTPRIM